MCVRVHACVHVWAHACMDVCVYACVCVCVCVHGCVHWNALPIKKKKNTSSQLVGLLGWISLQILSGGKWACAKNIVHKRGKNVKI